MGSLSQLRLSFTGRKKKPEKPAHKLVNQKKSRLEAIRLLGGKCSRCGFDDIRALQIDHVRGGGKKERDTAKNTYQAYGKIYQRILDGSRDYQVLCANCNWIKRYENRECGERVFSKFSD